MAKADPTLVKAAFTEASSRAGADVPNMKPLYDSTKSISTGYLEQITGIMTEFKNEKERERIALDKQLDGFKKIADETLVSLFSLKEAMPGKVINAFEDRVKELQDEFELVNTLGDGDSSENRKARMRLMGELNKISQQTINLRKTTMNISDRVSNNLLNTDVIQKDIIEHAKSILDFKNLDENSDVVLDYGRDGIIFKIDGKEFTINDLDEAFPGINKDVDSGFLDMTKASATQGVFDASGNNPQYNYKKDEQRGYFKGKINDKDDFQQYLRRLEGIDVPSFKEALLDDVSIPVGILSNMFVDGNGTRLEIGQVLSEMDYNGDGVITEADGNFNGVDMKNFKENMDIIIDVLTNTSNPAFDLETSKDLLADYYIGGTRTNDDGTTRNIMGIDEQIYNKNYHNEIKKKQSGHGRGRGGDDPEGSSVYSGWMHYTEQDTFLQDILDGNPIAFKSNEGSDTFIENNNGTWTGKASGITITKEELVRDYLYMSYRAKMKFPNDFNFSGRTDTTYDIPETISPKNVDEVVLYSYDDSQFKSPNGKWVDVNKLYKKSLDEIVSILQTEFRVKDTHTETPAKKKIAIYGKKGKIYIDIEGAGTENTVVRVGTSEEEIKKLIKYFNQNTFKYAYWPAS